MGHNNPLGLYSLKKKPLNFAIFYLINRTSIPIKQSD